MKLTNSLCIVFGAFLYMSCGGSNVQPAHGFTFHEQGTGWRLIQNPASSDDTLVLDLVGPAAPVRGIYLSASVDSECSWTVERVCSLSYPCVSTAKVSGLLLESGFVLRGGKSVVLPGPIFRITIKANGIGSRNVQLQPIHLAVVYADRDAVVEESLSVGSIQHN